MKLSKIQRLKFLRENAGLSQKDMAEALDMTKSGYSLIETGKTKLNETHLVILKDKFNFDINFILQGDELDMPTVKELPQNPPAWAEELMKKIDKLMEIQSAQTGKMLELLGKPLGKRRNYVATMQVAYSVTQAA